MHARIALLSIVIALLAASTRPFGAAELIFVTQEFAPYNYTENGVVAGPTAECPMRSLPWRRAQQEVQEGKAHGIFSVGWNAERAKWLWYSPPILDSEYGFFVRDDNPLKFTRNSDVKG
jgi:polar amino acid transport system substrate-binding protein